MKLRLETRGHPQTLRREGAGFSLIETLLVLVIATILSAIAIPAFLNAMKTYRLSAAVSAATGAIQSTRFQAIMRGYQYQITFTPSTLSYQVYNKVPPATSFSAVGSAVPIARLGDVTLDQTVTLTFNANGTVSPTAGNMPFSISNGIVTKAINVSGVGNVSVSP
jgi:prepilin-type N-terminal cleavage/methylation domain-containing protein